MKAFKFIGTLVLTTACFAANATAANVNYVSITNRDASGVSVDIRVGLSKSCSQNATAATLRIAPRSVERVTITSERWMCLRLSGAPSWRVEPLAGGRDYAFTVN